MIVDTSVFLTILQNEPEVDRFSEALARGAVAMSAGTLLETRIVVHSRAPERMAELEELIDSSRIAIIPVDERQARIGGDAYRRYGRGSGHPAKLNYGDCFSYALAIARDEPLLFKGDDFVHTDVRVAASET